MSIVLNTYKSKRDFNQTEPTAAVTADKTIVNGKD